MARKIGLSVNEIVSTILAFRADVHARLAYYYDNKDCIDRAILEGELLVEKMKANAPPSLLKQKLERMKADAANDSVSS